MQLSAAPVEVGGQIGGSMTLSLAWLIELPVVELSAALSEKVHEFRHLLAWIEYGGDSVLIWLGMVL